MHNYLFILLSMMPHLVWFDEQSGMINIGGRCVVYVEDPEHYEQYSYGNSLRGGIDWSPGNGSMCIEWTEDEVRVVCARYGNGRGGRLRISVPREGRPVMAELMDALDAMNSSLTRDEN